MQIELLVNGRTHRVDTDPERSLLNMLREDLDFTGTKYGCGEGECGACTVLLDGQPARSCLTPVKAAAGKHITTIEGLEKNGALHPVQQAFLEADALQCGYCTSGMVLAGVALLQKNPSPQPNDIIRAMQGNICRCGTYPRIVHAIQSAAASMKRGEHV
jgi:aerobic-type carbon monoxide dehydrogenase small subunit (CoxS/CutS family)